MRSVHRIVSLFVVIVTLYLGVTGTIIQLIDLETILTNAPATDPDMMAIREDKDGPDNYRVLEAVDYTAPTLHAQFNFQAGFTRLIEAAHSSFGGGSLDYAELRMGAAGVEGFALSDAKLLHIDLTDGRSSVSPAPQHPGIPIAPRNDFKHLHRMTTFPDWTLWINPLVGSALGVFVVTGVVMWWQLLSARKRIRRPQWFWVAGGWWRTLHRWLSILASAFILVIALSGTWLAVESLIFGFYLRAHLPPTRQPVAHDAGVTPLQEERLQAMIAITLKSFQASMADQPLKVLRLRIFGGMPQGVVIAGLGDETQQAVFNTRTGRRARLTEPGYPDTGFPFGWQAHQIAKQVHRGSYFGMTGRWMDLFGGVAIVYLSVSGIVMYVEMWNRRRRAGRRALLWA
jgi:uncharacterized iron-regulated membrane protein